MPVLGWKTAQKAPAGSPKSPVTSWLENLAPAVPAKPLPSPSSAGWAFLGIQPFGVGGGRAENTHETSANVQTEKGIKSSRQIRLIALLH